MQSPFLFTTPAMQQMANYSLWPWYFEAASKAGFNASSKIPVYVASGSPIPYGDPIATRFQSLFGTIITNADIRPSEKLPRYLEQRAAVDFLGTQRYMSHTCD